MIVKLDRKQQATTRHQVLGDVVWAVCNDTLREYQLKKITTLAPIEVYMSAREFSHTLLNLADIDEGIDYEIDDLEAEAEGNNDAVLVMMVATVQMQAMKKQEAAEVITRIYQRIGEYELFMPLLSKFADKEETRWLEGKRTDLLKYELKQVELEGGGLEEKKAVVTEVADAAINLSKEEIRGVVLALSSINIVYNHAFDEQIKKLLEKLGVRDIAEIKVEGDYVAHQSVENQVGHVASGATGIRVNKGEEQI